MNELIKDIVRQFITEELRIDIKSTGEYSDDGVVINCHRIRLMLGDEILSEDYLE